MSQLVLETENEQNLKLIKELAEKLNIHCRLVLQKTTQEASPKTEDPLLSLDGILNAEGLNISENHDHYIGQSIKEHG